MSISNDSVVSMQYELKDAANGEILDSNLQGAPISFIMGRGQIIPGLESQIKELNDGESQEIKVSSKEAYGEYDKNALQTLPREQFAGIELEKGMTLHGQGENGDMVQVIVQDFNNENVSVDFNHPLAGKDLLFNVNITEVREATQDELQTGVVGGAATSCCGGEGCCGAHDHKEHDNGSCCGSH